MAKKVQLQITTDDAKAIRDLSKFAVQMKKVEDRTRKAGSAARERAEHTSLTIALESYERLALGAWRDHERFVGIIKSLLEKTQDGPRVTMMVSLMRPRGWDREGAIEDEILRAAGLLLELDQRKN